MSPLRRGLDLDQGLALFETALLLEAEDLEAVEVAQVLSPLDLGAALEPVGLLPLLVDLGLLPELLDGAGTGATGQVRDNERGEKSVGERDGLAGDGELGV